MVNANSPEHPIDSNSSGMDFALRGDDPFTWLGDSECFCALVGYAVAADAEILGHIWGRDLSVGEFLNLKGGFRREGGVFDCDGRAWCGMDDECRASIHVDIFEADKFWISVS